jgi:hypothetical protein
VRVRADARPTESFDSAEPTLEDVYFAAMRTTNAGPNGGRAE